MQKQLNMFGASEALRITSVLKEKSPATGLRYRDQKSYNKEYYQRRKEVLRKKNLENYYAKKLVKLESHEPELLVFENQVPILEKSNPEIAKETNLNQSRVGVLKNTLLGLLFLGLSSFLLFFQIKESAKNLEYLNFSSLDPVFIACLLESLFLGLILARGVMKWSLLNKVLINFGIVAVFSFNAFSFTYISVSKELSDFRYTQNQLENIQSLKTQRESLLRQQVVFQKKKWFWNEQKVLDKISVVNSQITHMNDKILNTKSLTKRELFEKTIPEVVLKVLVLLSVGIFFEAGVMSLKNR